MNMQGITKISDRISYIEATNNPLSADIGIIQTERGLWLYDIGNDSAVVSKYLSVFSSSSTQKFNIVISHFHADHMGNLERMDTESINKLYVSRFTQKHLRSGIIVENDLYMEGLHIFPLPSSHAKGCLGLEIDETYAFVGDALYSKAGEGTHTYNVQKLKEEIAVLKKIKAPLLLASHEKGLIMEKQKVLKDLESLYAKRNPLANEICVHLNK